MKANACGAIRAGADQWRGRTKSGRQQGKCKSIRIAVCFDTSESISINYMFITTNSRRLQDNKSCCSLSSAWRAPRTPPPPQTSLGLYKRKIFHIKRNWKENQYAYLICLCLPLFFTQSQLLSPKAHILLLVAIAFSSTILPSPNPHTDLLCALVINYLQVKRLKRAGPMPDRATLMNHTS